VQSQETVMNGGNSGYGRKKNMINGRISGVQKQKPVINGGISGVQMQETVKNRGSAAFRHKKLCWRDQWCPVDWHIGHLMKFRIARHPCYVTS